MSQRECVQLTLPSDLGYLPLARQCARTAAERFGFSGEALLAIELAVEELLTSIIELAFAEARGEITLSCARAPLGIELIFQERGLPFDPREIPEYRKAPTIERQSASGIGMFLLHSLVDQVEFNNRGMEGREYRLLKYLPHRSAAETAPAPAPESAPAVIPEKVEYQVRRLAESEAIEVARCAYKSHGYTFFDDHIYYPDRLIALNRSGEMISAVAVTAAGRFMGHAALVYPAPGASALAELTFTFVNVEYRSQGCMQRLCDFLFHPRQHGQDYPLSAIYVYAVTNHLITQKVMAKYDFHVCGLLLATSPATWEFKGIAGDQSQRISMLLNFRYLETPPVKTLYAPPRHQAMIERLYRNLGGRVNFAAAAAGAPAGVSELKAQLFASENCADLHVQRCGATIGLEIKAMLRDLCLKQVASITLFLGLEDPATPAVVDALEQLGFFFAGILPGTSLGDCLLLQYLNNVPLDYGKLLLQTEEGREITAYVKAHDPNCRP